MLSFSNPHISIATIADVPVIKDLLNISYRGEGSKQGWTTEANLIAGTVRTDENMVQDAMLQKSSAFLKFTNEQQQITGCVNLQLHDQKIYLGMFSVLPQLQGAGIGKELLKAAEEYTLYLKCRVVYMTVITVRTELINWYKRHGYADTGERRPFIEDGVTGKHLQPLEFAVLEKTIVPAAFAENTPENK